MRNYLEEAAYIHGQTPEFNQISSKDVFTVKEGKIAIGSMRNRFRSERFDSCSGIAIKDRFNLIFGFFHVYPDQELTEADLTTLSPLIQGFACLIQGSESTEQHRILGDLFKTLGIRHTDTIPVDTCDARGISYLFHLAYRPVANQILVARISHKDVLTFPAFKS